MDAEKYLLDHAGEHIRTVREQVSGLPYPDNLESFCFYAVEALEDGNGDDEDTEENEEENDTDNNPEKYYSWDNDVSHYCFRPCRVLERNTPNKLYTVELLEDHNIRVVDECLIDADATLFDVPEYAIRIVDRPYTADVFLPQAFRHEIIVPDGLYPDAWMRKNLRKPKTSNVEQVGQEFIQKRRKFLEIKGLATDS